MISIRSLLVTSLSTLLSIASCAAIAPAPSRAYKTQVLNKRLDGPWAVVPLNKDDLYVTEKSGHIKMFHKGKFTYELKGVPNTIADEGQGGLMDMAFHPQFDSNHYVYLTFATHDKAVPQDGANTRISRFVLKGDTLTDEKVLIQGGYGTDTFQFGSRLVFGSDGKLYATIGDRHNKFKAQDLAYLNVKVIRINDDGTIPTDNPFYNKVGANKAVYSFGHRNPQGLDIQPGTGLIFDSEHGPTYYDAHIPGYGDVGLADEVNVILPSRNYGWPIVFGTPQELPWSKEMLKFAKENNVKMPVREFSVPDGIAPSGIAFYKGTKLPQWKNDLFVSCLRGYIYRLRIDKTQKVIDQEILFKGDFGRIRDVASGLDGYLYFVTDYGQLVKVVPQ